jgi:hypothetical protein
VSAGFDHGSCAEPENAGFLLCCAVHHQVKEGQ